MLSSMFRGIGNVVGTVVGVPLAVIATTLGLTVEMVEEAVNAGCKTQKEISNYWRGR